MSRVVRTALFVVLLVLLSAAWVRSAWIMPQRNIAFDFSINYTGARLLSPFGADRALYDRETLREEAARHGAWDGLYRGLYLTYIQTPITAVVTLPFSHLEYEQARDAFLVFSNLLLLGAAGVTIWALRPSWLLVLAAAAIFATNEAMFESLRLGQVDALIVFCLAFAFALLRRGPRPLIGVPLALAAILKLSPVVVIGYFAWRRWWRVVAVAAVSLGALAGLSVLIAGWDNNLTFVREMMPRLMKGSPWFYNVSISGAVLRAWLGHDYWAFEDEPPGLPMGLRLLLLAIAAALVVGAYIATRHDAEAGFMLSIAVAILISPVAWSFYTSWLLLSLLWLLRRYEDRRAWWPMIALVALYPLLTISPEHFPRVSENLFAVPLKTLALAAYALLIARESRASTRPVTAQPVPLTPRPLRARATR